MIINLASAMAERGHEVYLAVLAGRDICYEISDKVQLICLTDDADSRTSGLNTGAGGGYSGLTKEADNRIAKLRRVLNRYRFLQRVVRGTSPDLIINFWFQSAAFCAFMGRGAAAKSIYAERGDPSNSEYAGWMSVLRKLTFGRLRGLAFQSEAAQNYFGEGIRKKSVVIPNPVCPRPDIRHDYDHCKRAVVTVGRLHRQKNQKLFIDAMALMKDTHPDYVAEIYGDGELEEELRRYIEEKGLQESVFLMGSCRDVLSRISDAAVFVLTSDYEGMPNALLEAMSIGLPCVCTDYRPGSLREMMDDGKSGLIVPAQNAAAAARAVCAFLDDPELARACGEEAQKFTEGLSPETVYDKWEYFFNDILKN